MILIIEDDLQDIFLLMQHLEEARLDDEVRIIRDGRLALAYLLQLSPAPYAIFLDLKLPGIGGIDLLREIRHEPRLYDLPVIVMTSSIDPDDAKICARHGVSAFLSKPVRVDIIKMIIDSEEMQRPFLERPIDPHFTDLASPMLHEET